MPPEQGQGLLRVVVSIHLVLSTLVSDFMYLRFPFLFILKTPVSSTPKDPYLLATRL
jgi:hypothetical protein